MRCMNVYTVAHYHSCHKMQRMSQIQNNIVAVVLQVATAIETIDMEHLRFNKSIEPVADPGGFHWFPRKPPLKNDCVTIKCFNYRGVRLDRDTVIRAVTVATKVVCRKFLIYFMYYY